MELDELEKKGTAVILQKFTTADTSMSTFKS